MHCIVRYSILKKSYISMLFSFFLLIAIELGLSRFLFLLPPSFYLPPWKIHFSGSPCLASPSQVFKDSKRGLSCVTLPFCLILNGQLNEENVSSLCLALKPLKKKWVAMWECGEHYLVCWCVVEMVNDSFRWTLQTSISGPARIRAEMGPHWLALQKTSILSHW